MRSTYCTLPLPRVPQAQVLASNEPHWHTIACSCGNVRLMRRSKDTDATRFALSGKLADVCAALDELAALETRNAWRMAMH